MHAVLAQPCIRDLHAEATLPHPVLSHSVRLLSQIPLAASHATTCAARLGRLGQCRHGVDPGNSDTSTVNPAYELKRDTGSPMVFKSNGLLVWGKSEGVLTSDRLALEGRVERSSASAPRCSAQTQYLRDSFKSIDYLVHRPSASAGCS